MPEITLQVTNAGRAALVAAGTAGTNSVEITQVGLSAATNIVPAPAQTALAGEHRRIASIGGQAVSADTIHMIARDESSASYAVAAFALYLADGTMFAIYGQNTPILSKSAAAIMLMGIDVKFADIAATSITFGNANFLNPPATTEIQGVVELATDGEAAAGTDVQRAIVPASLKYTLDQRLGGFVQKNGDTMSGRLTFATGDEAIRMRAGLPFISGYTADGTTRNGYAQFQPTVTRLASDAGAVAIAAGGIDRLTISAAGTATFGDLGIFNRTGYGVMANSPTDSRIACAIAGSPLAFMQAAGGVGRFGVIGNGELRFATNGVDRIMVSDLGTTIARGLVVSDAGLTLGVSSGNADLTLDVGGDLLRFGRASNSLGFFVGGVQRVSFGADGVIAALGLVASGSVAIGTNLTTAGSGSFASGATFGDTAFAIAIDGTGPYVQGDPGDTLRYLRGPNVWRFSVAGATVQDISAAGVNLTGALTVTGPISQAGNQVWHVGNDGSGSGLDADLLDGQHAAAFALRAENVTFRDITADRGDGTGVVYLNGANTRFLYYNGATYSLAGASLTINGGLAWTATNDGSGSGLDADLLDGRHADQFWRPDNDGPASGLDADLLDGLHASQFWRPDNDGPGSGLDADTVDGFQGNAFARIVASSSAESGGYRLWSDGFKECWGAGSVAGNGSGSVTYPVTFDAWSKAFIEGGAVIGNAQDNNPFVTASSTIGFSVFNAHDGGLSFTYYAIGY